MAKRAPYLGVHTEAIVRVGTQAQFNFLALVRVQTEQIGPFSRVELGQYPDGELVCLHNMVDCLVICEPSQNSQRRVGVREMGQRD
jgi:hypothetical protein